MSLAADSGRFVPPKQNDRLRIVCSEERHWGAIDKSPVHVHGYFLQTQLFLCNSAFHMCVQINILLIFHYIGEEMHQVDFFVCFY